VSDFYGNFLVTYRIVDDWKTIVSFWDAIFSGGIIISHYKDRYSTFNNQYFNGMYPNPVLFVAHRVDGKRNAVKS